jgi:nitroimidazol reductase NimA-like FMN-containing flavoprotein (pyridoxamine 5'-phosphate oxidase superfamily)
MTIHETSDIEVLSATLGAELLRESVVGRLAVTVDGRPDIFPVNPGGAPPDDRVPYRCRHKLAATKRQNVAFEVDVNDTHSCLSSREQALVRAPKASCTPEPAVRSDRSVRLHRTARTGGAAP